MGFARSVDIATAVTLYYAKLELTCADIRRIFGVGSGTATKLKKTAVAQMVQDGVPTFNAHAVETVTAYKAWGLDISDLERRMTKLRRLEQMRSG